MRKASLIVMLVPLFTGCVGASTPDSQAVTAPSSPCVNSAAAQGVVTLILTSPAALVRGTSSPIVATGIDVNGLRTDVTSIVTWSSSNFLAAAATDGTLYAIGVGSATIRASLGEVTATADIDILAATLQAISLHADAESAPAGSITAWHVTGSYDDGSTQDLTASADWTTSDASIATVEAPGEVHAVASGMAVISVAVAGHGASAPMMVTQ